MKYSRDMLSTGEKPKKHCLCSALETEECTGIAPAIAAFCRSSSHLHAEIS